MGLEGWRSVLRLRGWARGWVLPRRAPAVITCVRRSPLGRARVRRASGGPLGTSPLRSGRPSRHGASPRLPRALLRRRGRSLARSRVHRSGVRGRRAQGPAVRVLRHLAQPRGLAAGEAGAPSARTGPCPNVWVQDLTVQGQRGRFERARDEMLAWGELLLLRAACLWKLRLAWCLLVRCLSMGLVVVSGLWVLCLIHYVNKREVGACGNV